MYFFVIFLRTPLFAWNSSFHTSKLATFLFLYNFCWFMSSIYRYSFIFHMIDIRHKHEPLFSWRPEHTLEHMYGGRRKNFFVDKSPLWRNSQANPLPDLLEVYYLLYTVYTHCPDTARALKRVRISLLWHYIFIFLYTLSKSEPFSKHGLYLGGVCIYCI